jgi:micrococcal nuclease
MTRKVTDPYVRRAKVSRVIDGDTLDLEVDLGYNVSLKIRGRLLGVDTPERGHKDFSVAKQNLSDLVSQNCDGEGYIIVASTKTGKYGRWLIEMDGINSVLAETWPYET